MASNQSGQLGEYAVASELSRRNLIATTFTRNMPGFDILVLNKDSKKTCRVSVKSIMLGAWSLNSKDYLIFDEDAFAKGVQKIVGKVQTNGVGFDFQVFVKIGKTRSEDKFFILSFKQVQEIINRKYKKFLDSKNGVRPKNPQTTHTTVKEEDIKDFEDSWDEITRSTFKELSKKEFLKEIEKW